MNKIIVIAVIIAIVIVVAGYKVYQNYLTEGNNQISTKLNATNSTVLLPIDNNGHKVIHITLNDGIGVKSP